MQLVGKPSPEFLGKITSDSVSQMTACYRYRPTSEVDWATLMIAPLSSTYSDPLPLSKYTTLFPVQFLMSFNHVVFGRSLQLVPSTDPFITYEPTFLVSWSHVQTILPFFVLQLLIMTHNRRLFIVSFPSTVVTFCRQVIARILKHTNANTKKRNTNAVTLCSTVLLSYIHTKQWK